MINWLYKSQGNAMTPSQVRPFCRDMSSCKLDISAENPMRSSLMIKLLSRWRNLHGPADFP